MKIDLYEYQKDDIPWFLANPRSMILYEPRLGKTVVSTQVLAMDPQSTHILIIAPKNALFTWRQHFLEFYPIVAPDRDIDVRVVKGKANSGAKDERREIWLKPITASVTVWICTYGVLKSDFEFLCLPSTHKAGVKFNAVICDEVHLRMKGRKNKTVEIVKTIANPLTCKRFHPLSGTMAGKGGPLDFFALLNIISKSKFSSYWRFANYFMEIIEGRWGKEIIGPKNLPEFWSILDMFSRRRFRKICAPFMPEIIPSLMKVEPTTEQLSIWSQIEDEGFVFFNQGEENENLLILETAMHAPLRKRQLMTCPKILDPSLGWGAALEDLGERLTDTEEEVDTHVVIFTAFTKAIPFIEQFLRLKGFNDIFTLQGGIEPEEQHERIQAFVKTKGIIICSIKYSQAFSLATATTAYVLGYEWDPNDNKQAIDRLVGQTAEKGAINAYFYSLIGMDEEIAESVNIKNKRITLTLGNTDNVQIKR